MPDIEFKTRLEELRPAIENLVRKVDTPETVISGFIWSNNPRSLIRFGNHGNQGGSLVQLHIALASFAAEMYPKNPYQNVDFADIGPGDEEKNTDNAMLLADSLAQAVLVSGMEPTHVAEITDLAHRYILARQKEGAK